MISFGMYSFKKVEKKHTAKANSLTSTWKPAISSSRSEKEGWACSFSQFNQSAHGLVARHRLRCHKSRWLVSPQIAALCCGCLTYSWLRETSPHVSVFNPQRTTDQLKLYLVKHLKIGPTPSASGPGPTRRPWAPDRSFYGPTGYVKNEALSFNVW
jgi:hypothetical protein